MYTDEDLQQAIDKGIFSTEQVEQFRIDIADSQNTVIADEENFKLLSGFNDIFVVIACGLLLVSAGWATSAVSYSFSMAMVAGLSWALAEFFVRQRKMALPAIGLLVSFLIGVFFSVLSLAAFDLDDLANASTLLFALLMTIFSAWLHWRRFRVPITIAAGAAVAAMFAVFYVVPLLQRLLLGGTVEFSAVMMSSAIFLSGIAVFCLAMWWDSQDLQRLSRKSDIAFWCHLLAAPMIVHPVFSQLGIFEGEQSLVNMVIVLVLYLLLSSISLIIDRRAFMVSSLIYVLVALTNMLENFGLVGDGFAYVGVVIGISLLMLSGFWHRVRRSVLAVLPAYIQRKVPAVDTI